jgi:hypothetical protein
VQRPRAQPREGPRFFLFKYVLAQQLSNISPVRQQQQPIFCLLVLDHLGLCSPRRLDGQSQAGFIASPRCHYCGFMASAFNPSLFASRRLWSCVLFQNQVMRLHGFMVLRTHWHQDHSCLNLFVRLKKISCCCKEIGRTKQQILKVNK